MGNRPNATRKLEASAAENRVKALDMRKQGKTYQQIAEALGVSVSTAHKYIKSSLQELADLRIDGADELRQMELERLDEALSNVTASQDYKDGDPQSIQVYIRLSESRRKLLGLDAPAKQDITSDGEKLTTFNVKIPTPRDEDGSDG